MIKERNIVKYILFIVTLFFLYPSSIAAAKEQDDTIKNVLVLNSYHQGLNWTKDQTEGIQEQFREQYKKADVLIENMDWKNYPTSENLKHLFDYFNFKYSKKKIDLIVTTDDIALQFALQNREKIFSDAPVIFSGVNLESARSITQGYDRVTGVLEETYPVETVDLALKINPSIKTVFLIYDNTESGLAIGHYAIESIKKSYPKLNIVSLNNFTYLNMMSVIQHLQKDSIILMTTYIQDVYGEIMEMDYAIREVSAKSSVPVYHIYDFGLNNGAIGGAMLSGKLQGKSAADIAVRVLSGENSDEIGYVDPHSKEVVIDYKQMKNYDISINQIPKYVEVINKPFSFYETYKSLVLFVAAIFAMLLILVNFLFFHIRRINKMKKSLSESHEELTQLYEELTASDEEMRQQYDEILKINDKIRVGEDKLSYLAYHDVLTGLHNKLSLYENAGNIFCPDNGKVALLFVDIDNFKNVNDTLGHAFGDMLIKNLSEKLTSLFKYNEYIYRLSGDEFIVLLTKIKDVAEAGEGADKILRAFTDEIIIQDSVLRVSVSIGIAVYPDHCNRLEQLLKYADIAMYKVKDNGKKNYMLYDTSMSDAFNERVNMEKYLEKALDNHEFELYYQPQIDPAKNKIVGVEALLRWNSPELGSVSPLRFIKVAEDTRLIIPLGTWVIKTACAFLKSLFTQGYVELNMSINISILQLLQPDFCDIVLETLQEFDIDPKYLELEITESILMESVDSIEMDLRKLNSHNINIALDDFGKGYSSLSYLSQLPITTLKVDKSFIDCITNENDNTLTGHIVTLGKSMGMSVVAEGVEKLEQLEYLMQYQCDKIQGYYYSKPLPERELLAMLERSNDTFS